MGISLNYWNYDHAALGYGIGSFFFFEPFLDYGGRVKVSFKLGMGISYLSNPYNEETNAANLTYSTYFSFPLFVGGTVYYMIKECTALKFTVSFQHISNGGLKQPNLGINYPVLSVGVERALNSYQSPSTPPGLQNYEKERRWEFGVGYAIKDVEGMDHKVGIWLLNLLYSHQVSRVNAIIGNWFSEHDNRVMAGNFIDKWRSSLLVGNEFLLGRINFSQQLGIYVFRPLETSSLLLQYYSLQYKISDTLFFGVGLKAHGQVADYLGLRLGVMF